MNCIYEDYHGECTNFIMMGTSMAKCCDTPEEAIADEDWRCPNDEDNISNKET